MIQVYFFKLNGCHHCETMKTILDQVKSIYNIPIKEIEHNDKKTLSQKLQQMLDTDNINAYPELKLINNIINKVYTYDGNRNEKDISEWIKKHSSNHDDNNMNSKHGHKTRRHSKSSRNLFGGRRIKSRHRKNTRKHRPRRYKY